MDSPPARERDAVSGIEEIQALNDAERLMDRLVDEGLMLTHPYEFSEPVLILNPLAPVVEQVKALVVDGLLRRAEKRLEVDARRRGNQGAATPEGVAGRRPEALL